MHVLGKVSNCRKVYDERRQASGETWAGFIIPTTAAPLTDGAAGSDDRPRVLGIGRVPCDLSASLRCTSGYEPGCEA